MPAGDRTGPEGIGPMTGRGLGFCTGHNAPGYMYPAPGRGMGRGYVRGMGYGFRGGRGFRGYGYGYMPYEPAPSKEEELKMLQSQAKSFERNLEDIRKRIDELKKNNE